MEHLCKNCKTPILESANFCSSCGGKQVKKRITLRNIITDFSDVVLGWDNKYFLTIKDLIVTPKTLIMGYIGGVRKRYVNPLTFFVLGMTISIIVFNIYSEEYLELSVSSSNVQFTESLEMPDDFMAGNNLSEEERKKMFVLENQSNQLMSDIQAAILQYFNIYSFALLPLYTFFTFIVYRKKFNFGEHLVINCYLQGIGFLLTTLSFFISVLLWPEFYEISILLLVFYYSYVFSKLFEHGFFKAILYLLKFVLFGLIFFILAILIIAITFIATEQQGLDIVV